MASWLIFMKGLILPNTCIENVERPFIFLAGPTRGAPEWQDDATNILFSEATDLTVINPRPCVRHSLEKYLLNGKNGHFKKPREWRRHYFELASKKGAIMFWLPGEERHDCKRPYGATTYFEVGEWMIEYSKDKSIRLCVGTDGKFPKMDSIAYGFSQKAPGLVIRETLEETCKEALRLARKQ